MTALGSVIGRGTLAARPAASIAGRLYFATDTALWYRDNGSSWDTNDTVTTKGDVRVFDGTKLERLAVGTNGQVLTADSVQALGVKWASVSVTFAGAKAFNSAVQSVANATDTALTLDSENFDSDAFHDPVTNTSRMTVPTGLGGKYLIIGSTFFVAATAGSVGRALRVRKNGTTNEGGDSRVVTASAVSLVTSVVMDLAAADYIELMAFQDSGAALNVGNAATDIRTTLQVVRLG